MTDTTSTIVNRTLRRLPNSAYRVREYLTEKEVDRLIEAARKRGRNSQRDVAAILLAYRHGLRASELCSLKWSQIDLRNGRLHVNRAKGGIESVHPICGPELRALRPLHRGRQLQPLGSYGWSNELAGPQSFRSRCIHTCCDIRQAISSLTTGRTPGAWLTILVIEICNQQRDILRLRLIGSRDFGRTSCDLVSPF